MPLTPSTAGAPLCDPATFLLEYDRRSVADLCSDHDAEVDPAAVADHPVLLWVLRAASGEVEAACAVGGRYSAADLHALPSGSNGAALVAGVVAPIAFERLRRRRGLPESDRPDAVAARATLAALRAGEAALPFLEVAAASVPTVSNYTPSELFLLHRPSDQAHRFFGDRGACGGAGHLF